MSRKQNIGMVLLKFDIFLHQTKELSFGMFYFQDVETRKDRKFAKK